VGDKLSNDPCACVHGVVDMSWRAGALMWTASAAGWGTIAVVTDRLDCALVALLCLICAAVWSELS